MDTQQTKTLSPKKFLHLYQCGRNFGVGLLISLTMAACSSINSVEVPKDVSGRANGLTYYMPNKDFLVVITVKDQKVTQASLGTTAAYPDLSQQYVLRYRENAFGKNSLSVGLSESGLLTSTKSTSISNVTDVFKNLAGTLGQVAGFRKGIVAFPENTCTTDGNHTFVYRKPGDFTACGLAITIKPRSSSNDRIQAISGSTENNRNQPGTEDSGIYYRQNIPYLMTVQGGGLDLAAIVFSPSASPTHFLPISRTFFSNNEADFGFVDGVPTKYAQETDGEALALLKLPADVIASYFSAIGSVFDSFKANDQKASAALIESLKLELAKQKYNACISAIKEGNDQMINELGCP